MIITELSLFLLTSNEHCCTRLPFFCNYFVKIMYDMGLITFTCSVKEHLLNNADFVCEITCYFRVIAVFVRP